MAFDGIITKKIVNELQNLKGFKIDKIFEPNKNTVILGLYGKSINLSLLLCINSAYPRVHINYHHLKNPSVAPNFCMLLRKHLIGYTIKNIYSFDLERIIFIDFENNENPNKVINKKLIIELMGKHSNIILTDSNDIIIDSIRHTSTESNASRDIYPTCKYRIQNSTKHSFIDIKDFDNFYSILEPKITEYIQNNIDTISDVNQLDINNFCLDRLMSNTFNGLSTTEIHGLITSLNLATLSKESLKIIYDNLKTIINTDNFKLNYTKNKKDFFISTDTSISLLDNKQNNAQEHNSSFLLNHFLDDFYFEKITSEEFKNRKNTLQNAVYSTYKKYSQRLSNITKKLGDCDKRDIYRLYGELITSNLWRIKNEHVPSINVENYYDNNEKLKIPLDSKYLPSYNAKRYFKKYAKLKNALQIVSTQKEETIKDIHYIESVIYELENCQNSEELELIHNEILENDIFSLNHKLNIKNLKNTKNDSKKNKNNATTKNKPSNFNPLKYVIDDYNIYVGRNNIENDYLTCKFACKTDLWFHTKDIHGSHVILKLNPGEIATDEIIYEAAKLAATHSKAKDSSHVPVDYCFVKYVKKPNGSKPGFVIYTNNKTIYV